MDRREVAKYLLFHLLYFLLSPIQRLWGYFMSAYGWAAAFPAHYTDPLYAIGAFYTASFISALLCRRQSLGEMLISIHKYALVYFLSVYFMAFSLALSLGRIFAAVVLVATAAVFQMTTALNWKLVVLTTQYLAARRQIELGTPTTNPPSR